MSLISIELTFEQALHQAIADVNRWRGHCMELHARLERGVNAALLEWSGTEKLPQIAAERLKLLGKLTASDGSKPDAKIHELTQELLQARVEWRDTLAHATSIVHLDVCREWVWHYMLPTQNGGTDKVGAITAKQAADVERMLTEKVNTLRSRLKVLKVPRSI